MNKIEKVKFLNDGQTLINDCVKISFIDGKLNATFDRQKIKEFEAINIIELYFKEVSKFSEN